MEQELYNTLQSTLSPDAATRSAAEQNLERLMTSPGEQCCFIIRVTRVDISAEGGLGLCKIALNQQLDISIRQSAAILLSQYIKKYWSGVFAQFVGPWPSEEIKKPFREALVAGLSDPSSKIRSAMVSTILLPFGPSLTCLRGRLSRSPSSRIPISRTTFPNSCRPCSAFSNRATLELPRALSTF
jgi:hypothetical protein